MINIGNIILSTAFMLSIASIFFMYKSFKISNRLFIAGKRIFYAAGFLIFLAVILLFYYFISDQFIYASVYNYSSTSTPLIYKITALWAGQEVSLLIWILILNICGIVISKNTDEFTPVILAAVAAAQGLMLLVLVVKSPFAFIWEYYPKAFQVGEIPANGTGLNMLLMDPWMIIHPPILYLGYASSAIPFGYALAALIRRDYDSWIKAAYPWIIFSSLTLGMGIFMGGYWAYKVLGWGGYWGWDPVENSSLIPWLISIVFIHGIILQTRKGLLKRANILIALSYFIFVMFSAFLTRSGIISDFSVHSFGQSDILHYLYLLMVLFFLGVSIYLIITRFKGIESEKFGEKIFTLEGMITYGIIILLIYSLIILAGTTMPITTGLLGSQGSVTEKFYNLISIPFGAMIISFIVLSMFASRKYSIVNIIICVILSIICGVLFNYNFIENITVDIYAVILFFLIFMIIIDLYKYRKIIFISSRTAHIGLAILILGIISSNIHSTNEHKQVSAGETIELDKDLSLTLKGIQGEKESNILITTLDKVETKDIRIPYLINPKTDSIYKEPYIIKRLTGDIYIIPEIYIFGYNEYTSATLYKDEEKIISGHKVTFKGFITNNMGAKDMTISADLYVDGRRYLPGIISPDTEKEEFVNQKISGTDKIIAVDNLNPKEMSVYVFITPDKKAVIPPDYLILDISYKKFIWLVWLGAIIICIGLIISISSSPIFSIRKK
ncbi:MAG: cytochrome c biogenesis protein CcsA [Spirochaetes bacterium]|nr:cytochrome c biogenesis protein CcsA [Spirochaetota bacterium]